MADDAQKFSYQSMGTTWSIAIWDPIAESALQEIQSTIVRQSKDFDHTYSRFIQSSFIWSLAQKTGRIEVPADLVRMLRLYERFNRLSRGKCNPLIGYAMSDLGYDAEYSLKTKERVRPVPNFSSALRIIDDTHIELTESVLIDLGALGKGYFVERISAYLNQQGIRRYLVDGSGDMTYKGNGEALRVGLEHPGDPSKVIGVVELLDGSMCGSGSNRRRWGDYHHTIDPDFLSSPGDIIATWVIAESAAIADGLATCLFLCEPEAFERELAFDYCLLNTDYNVKRSAGFTAELF